jgi:large subunit ribosomal protein L33
MKTVVVIMAHLRDWRGSDLARNELRPVIKLRSTAGTGYTYVTTKNRRNDPDRLVLRKYDPTIRRHVPFREDR